MARELIALLALALPACHCGDPEGPREVAATRATGAPPLASAAFYRLDAAPQPACIADRPCETRLVLRALGDYHINPQYPVKLVSDPLPEVRLDGTGTFSLDAAQVGTLTIKFRAARPGTAHVTGTFKLSVCTDSNCEIATPNIGFDVTAS